jgi:hypothetical protein
MKGCYQRHLYPLVSGQVRVSSVDVRSFTGRRFKCKAAASDNIHGSHHLVFLVLENVAMPYIRSGEVTESGNDPSNLPGIGPHNVLESQLVYGRSCKDQFTRRDEQIDVIGLAVKDLKVNHVQVNRVGIIRRVGMRVLIE